MLSTELGQLQFQPSLPFAPWFRPGRSLWHRVWNMRPTGSSKGETRLDQKIQVQPEFFPGRALRGLPKQSASMTSSSYF